jgi:hypothetical protein
MNEFFTWAALATFGGASIGTGIVTQFIKGLPALDKIPTQIVTYFIAVIILAGANLALGNLSGAAEWGIIPLNAILVSYAANGGYDFVGRFNGEI